MSIVSKEQLDAVPGLAELVDPKPLKKYLATVAVMVMRPYKVLARSENEALILAMRFAHEEADRNEGVERLLNVDEIEANELSAGENVDTCICDFCGEQSIKTEWGPGFMKCPSCGERPPAACDVIEAEYKVKLIF